MKAFEKIGAFLAGLFSHRGPEVLAARVVSVEGDTIKASVTLGWRIKVETVNLAVRQDSCDSWTFDTDRELSAEEGILVLGCFDLLDLSFLVKLTGERNNIAKALERAQAELFRHGIGTYTGPETQVQSRARTVHLKRELGILDRKIKGLMLKYDGRE